MNNTWCGRVHCKVHVHVYLESDNKLEDIALLDIMKYFESKSIRNWLSDISNFSKLF